MKDINKKTKFKKIILYSFLSILFGILLSIITIFTFKAETFQDYMDSILVAGVIVFSVGWLLYITNAGIFSLVAYGTQRFFNALLKRKHRTYEDMMFNRSKVDMLVILSLWLGGFIVLLAAIGMYIYYYTVLI
ncbi:DUF3899 domain-containing protein [Candidatus Izemoplasma sp. B36]|uniref:DUF3899 domain-containing protein n=1 Tax=Candidatus Izemoplasma sp. B36 TaxID=3242468 RepID=UPI0035566581